MSSLELRATPSFTRCSVSRFGVWTSLLLFCAGPVHAQDARTIIGSMINAYRSLDSYEGRATVTGRQTLRDGRALTETSFVSTLTYQKPNKLKIEFSMPQGGRTILFDGQTLTYSDHQAQSYRSVSVQASDLHHLLPALAQFQVGAKLDTLYFLASSDLPPTISSLARLPDQSLGGRSVFVVKGRETNKTTRSSIEWTWWIDKQTKLLSRIQGRALALRRASVREGKRAVIKEIVTDNLITQNIIDPKPNARIEGRAFEFKPPAGAARIGAPVVGAAGRGR